MASKQFTLDSIGEVTVYKRKGVKRISLRINGGAVKVTQPAWLPYATGLQFAKSQNKWITDQRSKNQQIILKNGQAIGKKHTLYFIEADKTKSKVTETQVLITHTPGEAIESPNVQAVARTAVKKALKAESELLLPPRLKLIADTYGFTYKNVRIRAMQSRWGSCTNNGDITLNCYLMMVPWDLIDYVLVHELTHTKHLNHGPGFWEAMDTVMPDNAKRRKQLKKLQSEIIPLQHN